MRENDAEKYLDQLVYDLLWHKVVSRDWIAQSLDMTEMDFEDIFDEQIIQAEADSEGH